MNLRSFATGVLALSMLAGPTAVAYASTSDVSETAPSVEATASVELAPGSDAPASTPTPTSDQSAPASSDDSATEAPAEPAAPAVPVPTATKAPAPAATVPAPVAAATKSARVKAQASAACVNDPKITLGASAATLGGTLELIGTGWCHPTDGGSKIGLKIDAGALVRADASVHPVNASIWATIQADPSGAFVTNVPMPDGTNVGAADGTKHGSIPVAKVGGRHTFTLLTGSLKEGDELRSVETSKFVLLDPSTPVGDPSFWGDKYTNGSATTWVQRSVSTDVGTLRIAGTGWLTSKGAPSTVGLKLNSSDSAMFERTTDLEEADPTIWAMGRAAKTAPNQFVVGADGSFDATVDLPKSLAKGNYFSARIASGRFGDEDQMRSVLTPLLEVDGATFKAPKPGGNTVCKPSTSPATVAVATPVVELGGKVRVNGTGWCNPAGGGSVVVVKIDEGAYSHLNSNINSNRTVWAVINADAATGNFSTDITIPDGTLKTSTPAMKNGAHTFRFLSGSMVPGDVIRTMEASFVAGKYAPNDAPLPIDVKSLKASGKAGMKVTFPKKNKARITLPKSAPGTWVFFTGYVADGSPRNPWGMKWFRLDKKRGVTVPLSAETPTGELRLVAQSGNQGSVGKLLGWTKVTLKAEPAAAAPPKVIAPIKSITSPIASIVTPAAAAATWDALGALSAGTASVDVKKKVALVTLPGATADQALYVTLWSPTQQSAGGWIKADGSKQVRLGLSAIHPIKKTGPWRIALQSQTGELVGWVGLGEGSGSETAEHADEAATASAVVVTKADTVVPAAAANPAGDGDGTWFDTTDALLLSGGALLSFVAALALILRRRKATV